MTKDLYELLDILDGFDTPYKISCYFCVSRYKDSAQHWRYRVVVLEHYGTQDHEYRRYDLGDFDFSSYNWLRKNCRNVFIRE